MVSNYVIRDTNKINDITGLQICTVVVCCEREYEPATIFVGVVVSCNIKLDSIVYRSRGCDAASTCTIHLWQAWLV